MAPTALPILTVDRESDRRAMVEVFSCHRVAITATQRGVSSVCGPGRHGWGTWMTVAVAGRMIRRALLSACVAVSLLVAGSALAKPPGGGRAVKVRGYFRKDGTYVQPHFRSATDGKFWNNWTTKGNVNPYTGRLGTVREPPPGYGQDVLVRGYYRADGTYVSPHMRAAPDGDPANNLRSASPGRRETTGVERAERAANLRTCLQGDYPSLCKRDLLTSDEEMRVDRAERAANLRTCLHGEYPSLCKRNLLTSDEAMRVDRAERAANLRTCLHGEYPSLCKRNLLTSDEAMRVDRAERAANLRTCLLGDYPSLCKRHLLSSDEAVRVDRAERAAASRGY